MPPPHKEKSQATAGKFSVCKRDSSASTHSHWVLICPVGGWGATQKVPLCERWEEGKELSPPPEALPGPAAEHSDLSLQWPVSPALNQHLFVQQDPGLSAGHWCCLYRRSLCRVAGQWWAGAAHSSQPAAWDISVTPLHPFLGSFPTPGHSLCRLQHCFWSRQQTQAKKSNLPNFWDTIPAEGQSCALKKKVPI